MLGDDLLVYGVYDDFNGAVKMEVLHDSDGGVGNPRMAARFEQRSIGLVSNHKSPRLERIQSSRKRITSSPGSGCT